MRGEAELRQDLQTAIIITIKWNLIMWFTSLCLALDRTYISVDFVGKYDSDFPLRPYSCCLKTEPEKLAALWRQMGCLSRCLYEERIAQCRVSDVGDLATGSRRGRQST